MDTKQEIIRRYFRENDSERKIARDLQINRKTVKSYLLAYLKAQEKFTTTSKTEDLQEFTSSPPSYNKSGRIKRKLTNEIVELIQEQLKDNERKIGEGLRKQIKKKIDIYEFLQSKGYEVGYTTVCNYIREQALSTREAYIRQEKHPGEECEFDWCEVKLEIGQVQKRLYMSVFSTSYGSYRFSKLYKRQDTLAFMESHNEYFEKVQGIHHEMVYDNMRVAVAEFVGRNEKRPTQSLINLGGWYNFRWRFCNARKGNEKGHVERSVEYIRRKAFSDISSFDSMESANIHLGKVIDNLNNIVSPRTGKSPNQMLDEERLFLWKYPGQMECYTLETLKVDKYSTFSYGTNHYSVPDYLVGQMVGVKIYSNRLKVYYNNLNVCTQERYYDSCHWYINLDHYLKTLSRKPGALHGSTALQQAPNIIKSIYMQFFINNPKDFVNLLLYCKDGNVSHERLSETIESLYKLCPKDISIDKIMGQLGNKEYQEIQTSDNVTDEIKDFAVSQLNEITRIASQTY